MHACKFASVVSNSFSCVWFFAVLQTVALQAPLSMGFSRQEYWSGLPCPSPEDLPNWGIEPVSLTSLELASRFFTTSTTWEASFSMCVSVKGQEEPVTALRFHSEILAGPPGEVLHHGWNSPHGYCSYIFGNSSFLVWWLSLLLTFLCVCISLAILFYTSLLGKDVWSLLLPAEDLVAAVCIIIFVTNSFLCCCCTPYI